MEAGYHAFFKFPSVKHIFQFDQLHVLIQDSRIFFYFFLKNGFWETAEFSSVAMRQCIRLANFSVADQ